MYQIVIYRLPRWFLSLSWLILGWFTPGTAQAQSTVFLNEVLANNGTLTDLSGNTPDWVELYNSSTNAVSLAGLSLSNDPTNPRRWIFPEGVNIRGRDYLVIYFDNNLPASAWNTGFGLSAGGDTIYLFDRSTNRLDSVNFGLQVEDFSIGRLQVAGGVWSLIASHPRRSQRAGHLG